MINHDLHEKPHTAEKPYEASSSRARDKSHAGDNVLPNESLEKSINQTLQLGEQAVDFTVGLIGLARTEALLAVKTIPNLVGVWLIMMPIILLTWCSFSALVAWVAYEASDEVGLSLLLFFLQQVLLLLIFRLLYTKYCSRITLPHTRAHIEDFVRGIRDGSGNPGRAQK